MKKNQLAALFLASIVSLFSMPLAASAATSPAGVKVSFADAPSLGSNLDHSWLISQGIDINGSPDGYLFTSLLVGEGGRTGTVVGYASPDFAESDLGWSDGETMTVAIPLASVRAVTLRLAVLPSPVAERIPASVKLDAYSADGKMIASSQATFVGVQGGVSMPADVSVSASVSIKSVVMTTIANPVGGLWLGSVMLSTLDPAARSAMGDFGVDKAKVLINDHDNEGDDKVTVRGHLKLAAGTQGVDIANPVQVTVGPISEIVEMAAEGKQGDKWRFDRRHETVSAIRNMEIDWKNGTFEIRIDKAEFPLVNPMKISLQVGNYYGETSVLLVERGNHWEWNDR